jgi:hypothetical protein
MRTAKKIFAVSSFLIFLISGAQCVRGQAAPVLLTEDNSSRAIAFDSITHVRDPLALVAPNNLTQDHRTRLALFGLNMELNAGESIKLATVNARDSRSRNFNLSIEFYGQVPSQNSITQVIVKLPDELANAGDVSISVTLRGQTSNEVLFNIKAQTEPHQVTLAHRMLVNGVDNYVDACFSFEFGTNGEAALPLTRNDWDIQFGNSPDKDQFNVSMVGDDRSRIMDLGALNWSDNFQVPQLTPQPVPAIEPSVTAVVGHMYVVHTKDNDTDLYALFRVEALNPLKSVTITWKSIQSPQ